MKNIRNAPRELGVSHADIPVANAKEWKSRDPKNIKYLIFHQEGSNLHITHLAKYYIAQGMPTLPYHLMIDEGGNKLYCNSFASVVTSNGLVSPFKRKSKAGLYWGQQIDKHALSVIVKGSFMTGKNKGVSLEPNEPQLFSILDVIDWAQDRFDIKDECVLGSCHVNRNLSPGVGLVDDLENVIWAGRLKEVFPPNNIISPIRLRGSFFHIEG